MTHERKDGDKSQADEARTPPDLFAKLNERFHFGCDICASEQNHLCGLYYDSEMDALSLPWNCQFHAMGTLLPSYCNPPYSDPSPFIEKAYNESLEGASVVMLLPADTSTKSYHNFCMKANEIIFLEGRVKFNNPDGTPMKGSPKFGSMVVVFDLVNKVGEHPLARSWDWRSKQIPL